MPRFLLSSLCLLLLPRPRVGGGEFVFARAFGVAELVAALLGEFLLVVRLALGDALLELADALAHAARELRQARAAEQQEYYDEDDYQLRAARHPYQKRVVHLNSFQSSSTAAFRPARRLSADVVRLVEKVLAPRLIRAPYEAHDLAVHVQREGPRPSDEVHARLLRRAAALLVVAALAARDEIIPRTLAPARARKHVVERKLRGRELPPAVLARRVVAQQYVLARERAALVRDVYVLDEAYHRGGVHRYARGVEHVAVVLLHARDALEYHHDGAPLGADVHRLVRGVQD